MYCIKCGTQLPDDAAFCYKCGAKVGFTSTQPAPSASGGPAQSVSSPAQPVLAGADVKELKCPSCGAPITPKFGEMVITCEYCGSSVSLSPEGWRSIQKHTMLLPTFTDKDRVLGLIHQVMDRGIIHRHLQESSTLEEMSLTMVPYWLVPVSARTTVVAANVAAEVGTVAATGVLAGILGGEMGGRRGGMGGGGVVDGLLLGTMLSGGMGGGSSIAKQTAVINNNYIFPVVGAKALMQYQPAEYEFDLSNRVLFDASKLKGVRVLNGDVGEETAKYQAKTLVDQLQSKRAHEKYHMIQQLNTQSDVGEPELLHAPIWFVRYDHSGQKIVLVVDANSGRLISTVGLS